MTRLVRILLLLIVCGLSGGAGGLTRAQLLEAEPRVREATVDLVAGLAAGTCSPDEAAEASRILASQSESPAEEYLLLQGAFRLYVKAGEYVRVVEISRHLQNRGYSRTALLSLVEHALEPVPRGVNVGELDTLLRALKDDVARSRKQRLERRISRELAQAALPFFTTEGRPTVPDVLEAIRGMPQVKAGQPFHVVIRCPLPVTGGEGFPDLPVMTFTNTTAATVLSRCAKEGGFAVRTQGTLQFLTRSEPSARGSLPQPPFATGEAADTIRKMKRISIGFVAFEQDEPLDEALERLILAVFDDPAGQNADFDFVLRSRPTGRFPLLRTMRASDTTFYDVLDLACRTAGAIFEVRGRCIVVLSGE